MPVAEPRLCRHCERRPAAPACVLCAGCRAVKRIRYLYRPKSWDDLEDATLQYRRQREATLRERANQRLPLFGPEENPARERGQ